MTIVYDPLLFALPNELKSRIFSFRSLQIRIRKVSDNELQTYRLCALCWFSRRLIQDVASSNIQSLQRSYLSNGIVFSLQVLPLGAECIKRHNMQLTFSLTNLVCLYMTLQSNSKNDISFGNIWFLYFGVALCFLLSLNNGV